MTLTKWYNPDTGQWEAIPGGGSTAHPSFTWSIDPDELLREDS
jgi:hypothetical protein